MSDFAFATITQLLQAYQTKQVSVVEVTSQFLDRIKQIDQQIKSYLTVTDQLAQQQAAKLDQMLADDPEVVHRLPLFGVPIALKDLYLTQGVETTAASKVLQGYVPPYSATAWQKLEQAGAVLLGKLNCDAWAHGSSGENSDYFPTHNPWNLDYVPGGSSSGSAAALAAGLALATAGTDTGGSIRLPAAFCNLVGLKPTYGRVSRYGVIAMSSSMDSIGHFTRTVEDSARYLSVTAGQDPYDATTPPVKVPSYHQQLDLPDQTITIGLPQEYFDQGLDSQVSQLIEQARKVMEQKLPVKFVSLSLPHSQYVISVYYILQTSEVSSNLARYDGLRYGQNRSQFGAEAKRRIMLGTYTLSSGYYDAYYKKAAQVRGLIKKDFDQAFDQVDLIMAPVSPTPAFKLGEKEQDPLSMYLSDILTIAANLAGIPALSLPVGLTDQHLPVGMQLMAPAFQEQRLFQLGHAFQQITDHHLKHPNL